MAELTAVEREILELRGKARQHLANARYYELHGSLEYCNAERERADRLHRQADHLYWQNKAQAPQEA